MDATTRYPITIQATLAAARALRDDIGCDLTARHAVRVAAELLRRRVDLRQTEPTDDGGGVVLPGWWACDDSGYEIEFPEAGSASDAAHLYVDGGDWPGGGAVTVWCERRAVVWDADAEEIRVTTVEEEVVEVDVPLDHAWAIREAMDGGGCGDDPNDHEWTSEGEGGCRENPGVWSLGGTAISISTHCAVCGLRRTVVHHGSQRGPGEAEVVTSYEAPEDEPG